MQGMQDERHPSTGQENSPQSSSITLTDAALDMALTLWTQNKKFDSLRLYLEGKGCDGFFYGVAFDLMTPDDLCIAHLGSSDLKLIVDRATQVFVEGSQIDWIDDERGRGFLVNNPKHVKYRGKFFKRDVWKKKLTSGVGM